MGFLDQMKQLMDMKQKMEEVKGRLDTVEVSASNDFVKITANGNRKIKQVELLRTDDKAALESKLAEAINEVLEKSENTLQSEMLAATKGMIPDVPGLH